MKKNWWSYFAADDDGRKGGNDFLGWMIRSESRCEGCFGTHSPHGRGINGWFESFTHRLIIIIRFADIPPHMARRDLHTESLALRLGTLELPNLLWAVEICTSQKLFHMVILHFPLWEQLYAVVNLLLCEAHIRWTQIYVCWRYQRG